MVGASFARTTKHDIQRRTNKNQTVQGFTKMNMSLDETKMNRHVPTEWI